MGDGNCSEEGIFGYRDVTNSDGFSIQDFLIDGTTGGVDNPVRLAIDRPNDRLISLNQGNDTVTFYDGFSTLTGQGTTTPSLTFDNATSLIDDPSDMLLLPNGSLLVANNSGDSILRFDPPFTNNMAPTVHLTTGISGPNGICFDEANNRFAVAQSGIDSTLVFNNATTFTATDTPVATLDAAGSFMDGTPEDCFFADSGFLFVSVDSNGVGDQTASVLGFDLDTLADGVAPLGNLGPANYRDPQGFVEIGNRLFIADDCEMEEFSPDDENGCWPLSAYDYDPATDSYPNFPSAAFVGFWAMADEPEDIAAAAGSVFTISREFRMVVGWSSAESASGVEGAGQGGGNVDSPDIFAVPDYPSSTSSACGIKSVAASSR